MLQKFILTVTSSVFVASAFAQLMPFNANQGAASNDFNDAMAIAMAREDGHFEGEIKGEFVEGFKARYKTKSPVFVTINRVERLPYGPDCQRMSVKWSVPELKGEQNVPVEINFSLNICEGGQPAGYFKPKS